MRFLFFVLVMLLGVLLWMSMGLAQSSVDPEEPLAPRGSADADFNDAADQSGQEPAVTPIVGPTIIVSSPQFFSLSPPLGLLGKSETTIAGSEDGKLIVEGWNDANGFIDASRSLSGFALSIDGGKTFTDGGSLPFGTFGGQPVVPLGDPWLSASKSGSSTAFLYASLALRSNLSTEVGITVHRGTINNGVLAWASPAIISAPGTNDFLDKEALAVGKAPVTMGSGASASPSSGAPSGPAPSSRPVYVTTTNFLGVGGSQIELYRSVDGGSTFSGPTIVKTPDAAGQQGSQPAVGPNGEVYVTWERGRFTNAPQILFRASTDGGATFGPLVTVATITGLTLFPPVGYNRSRYNDFPRIAVDRVSNHMGRIYIVYHDAGSNANVHTDGVFFKPSTGETIPTGGVRDGDVYLRYSDNGGATWSSPTLVSSPAPGDGKVQFWPVMSVQSDGSVDVLYHQDTEVQSNPVNPLATNISIDARFPGFTRRRSSYQSIVDEFLAHSTDGGVTFQTPVRVNAAASNWSIAATNIRPNFGDYITSVAVSQKVLCSWAQGVLYDIDPGPGVNNRFVPSAAFALVDFSQGGASLPALAMKRETPSSFSLSQNFPNPFNPTTVMTYDLREGRHVSLKVYNTLGEEVATLVDDYRDAGQHSVSFDGRNLSSGVYVYKLVAGDFISIQKMVLAK